MELLNTLYNLMGLVFVLGTIISMGLGLTMAQITGPLRNLRFVIMALLANFVIAPVAAYILIQVFTLDGPLAIGLLLVSLAAGAPGLPKMAEFAKLDTAAATGLMVLLVVVTIIVMPIVVPLVAAGISVTFWDIASGLIFLILVPLALSLFVRARWETFASEVRPFFAQASNLSLLILMVLMVVLNFSNVINLIGSGGLLASLILVICHRGGRLSVGQPGRLEQVGPGPGRRAAQYSRCHGSRYHEFRQRGDCDDCSLLVDRFARHDPAVP